MDTNDIGLIDADSPWKYCDSELEKAKYQRRIALFLIPLLRRNSISSVLEVGANSGQGTLMLQQLGLDAHAVDPHFRSDVSELHPCLKRASGLYLPYGNRRFELSFSFDVIEHVGTVGPALTLSDNHWRLRRQFVDELCRVSCEMVVITTANKRFPFDEHGTGLLGSFRPHSTREQATLSADELVRLFRRNGFELERHLDPTGFFEMDRLRRSLGEPAANLAEWWLRLSSNRLLGGSMLNPHLFLSFRRR
ncbi:class I SAM-dependent methyltransferase [Ideonella sp.]|uniref:class I SAM-dependent methyltransferase n=1 Tax=Ideonella sp. TaxID=1929293 RepID=UPI0037C0A0CA